MRAPETAGAPERGRTVDVSVEQLPRRGHAYKALAWAVLVASLVTTLFLWRDAAEQLRQQSDASLDRFAARTAAAIDEGFDLHTQVLLSFRSLFQVGDHVSAEVFRHHFEALSVGERFPAVQAVQYSALVPHAAKARFEQAMRERLLAQAGIADYAIKPAGERPLYTPVVYTEPLAGNEVALGFDSLGSPAHREAVERARDSGRPAVSAPVMLLQGDPGIVIRVPVYAPGMPLETVEQRRAAFVGLVSGVFRAVRVMAEVMTNEALGYRLRVEDLGALDEPPDPPGAPVRLLFDSLAGAGPFAPALDDLRVHVRIVAGRLWAIKVARTPKAFHWQAHPLMMLLGGVFASLVSFAAVMAFAVRYDQAAKIARRLGREAQAYASRLKAVIDSAVDGILTLAGDGTVLSANVSAQRMFGLAEQDMVGRPIGDFVPHAFGTASGPVVQESSGRRADGSEFPVDVAFTEMQLGDERQYVGVVRDISERRRTEERIRHMALHDALTGLPNRALLEERLAHATERARREGRMMALLFVDLDRFKNINDSLGHHVGDQVLCEVAHRLRGAVRHSDIVARMGGDEFVVLLPDIGSQADCEAVARKMLDALTPPMVAAGHELRVTASIGVAAYPDAGHDPTHLMRHADRAMYLAKDAGRNTYRLFTPGGDAAIAADLQIENDLHRALERDELVLYFQPQFECHSGRLVGAEALVRWHRDGRLVAPEEFIPVAEDTGLIVPIGEWALREACRQAAGWQQRLEWPVRVAVNLSPRQLEDEQVVERIAQTLQASGLPAQLLELEITENAVVRDTRQAAFRLQRLRALGVSIAIDDFGVGYSSLSYLQELPVDKFKIDHSFVARLQGPGSDARLVRALIAMAHSLDVGIVAEGVETPAQLRQLQALGCDEAQGYLLGRPVPAAQFLARIVALQRAGHIPVPPEAVP